MKTDSKLRWEEMQKRMDHQQIEEPETTPDADNNLQLSQDDINEADVYNEDLVELVADEMQQTTEKEQLDLETGLDEHSR